MGQYSILTIGKLRRSYKYEYPSYLTFIFEPSDYFVEYADGDDDLFSAIGYKTTCDRALLTFERYGYTLEFFADIYKHFRPELESILVDNLISQCECQNQAALADGNVNRDDPSVRVEQYLHERAELDSTQEISAFIDTLRDLLSTDFQRPPFDQPYVVNTIAKLIPNRAARTTSSHEFFHRRGGLGKQHGDLDFESFELYVEEHFEAFPPSVLMCSYLLSLFDYQDLASLFYVRCALGATDRAAEVRLDVADMVEDEDEAKNLHFDSAALLVDKIKLYNRLYQRLFETEETVRANYVRSRARDLLKQCDCEMPSFQRGKLLEELTELIFTSNNSLELIGKRISTGDEEIDLIIKNNIDRPFWMAFQLPTFFVECKNWSSKVGSKELRDFEGKMRNHAKFTKLGFFVSVGGFTKDVADEMKRLGRDDYHIVLLARAQLDEFANSDVEFFNWLEKHVAMLH
jgi:hypothetical protein